MISIRLEVSEGSFGQDKFVLINKAVVKQCILTTLMENQIKNARIIVVFGKDELLRSLKRQFFQEDHYTDVLTFRLDEPVDRKRDIAKAEDKAEGSEPTANPRLFEGEVYISPEIVRENSETYGVSFENELARVIIHGALHLLGYEDTSWEKKSVMSQKEDEILKKVNFADILRSS